MGSLISSRRSLAIQTAFPASLIKQMASFNKDSAGLFAKNRSWNLNENLNG